MFLLSLAALVGCGVVETERTGKAESVSSGGVGGGSQPIAGSGGGETAGSGGTTGGGGSGGGPSGTGGAGGGSGAVARDAAPAFLDGPPTTSPPPSGATLIINGREVPREKAIVILHIGHSNMAGRAHGPAEMRPYFFDTHPNLWRYQKGGVWTPAREFLSPDGGPDRSFPQGAGPGMALLRVALSYAPDAYVISIGNGQSLEFQASCFTFRKGGLHWPKTIEPALELKGKVTFGGLFTMFGYDARTNPKAQNGGYIECLKGLAADYRAELDAPDLPFVAGDYERGASGSFSPGCCGAPGVIAQLAMIPQVIPRSFLIPTQGISMQDNHHYDMTGHKQWAERAFEGMSAGGMVPWATVKPP